jgi:pimeloyl-ACP methyl ester carboxylesterase
LVPVDLLGHGTAPRPTDVDAYGDVDGLVHAALPEGPVDAVGFSAGASVLLHLAVDHPGRFQRLALLGLGDNVFGGTEPMLTVDALEGRTGPEDVQGRLFRPSGRIGRQRSGRPGGLPASPRPASDGDGTRFGERPGARGARGPGLHRRSGPVDGGPAPGRVGDACAVSIISPPPPTSAAIDAVMRFLDP